MDASQTDDEDLPLSQLLRSRTRQRHTHAETRPFVVNLTEGRLNRDAHGDLLVQLRSVYGALEEAAGRFAGDPVAAPFVRPELWRTPSIEDDLVAERGADWREGAQVLDATRAYVARLGAMTSPAAYVAHAYTRYLGDLSGGQIIARMMQRHYGMPPSHLTFYTFEGIAKPKPYKDRYRESLDAVALDRAGREACAAEAVVAFDLNAAMFAELGARHAPG